MDTKSTDFTLQDLANSVKFMGEKFDDFNGTVNKLLEEMKEIRKENTQLYENNKRLSQDIGNLKYRWDSIEQNNLNSIIEIIVLPKVTNEKCIDTVTRLATVLNTVITIEEAFSVPFTVKGEHKIIARLAKPGMKNAIITNCKQNKTLNLSNIIPEWSNDKRLYINQHLIKHKRQLHGKARATAKEKGYKHICINQDADILNRKDESTKVRKIFTEQDLLLL